MHRSIQSLTDGTFDVLILGGGITGAGTALDAALRGLRVALIDQGDFASGTSSVSSKLVHGGLRYLEHASFRLVYEALQERRLLLQNAPHLVHPLRFLLPFYQSRRIAPWKWRLGLTLYDLLAGRDNLKRHRSFSRKKMLEEYADLRPESLTGGAEFYDAQMDDARLCIEVLKTAAEHGACLANYVGAIGFTETNGKITGVRAHDQLTGVDLHIAARQIVNATGPWVDHVCRLADPGAPPLLQPSKGIHIVVHALTTHHSPLTTHPSPAFLLLHPDDGRVFFVLPWLGKTLIGTTETPYDGEPHDVTATKDEVDYLLRGFNHYFQTKMEHGDVLGNFAGLRPLLRDPRRTPGARSREFRLFWSSMGLLTVAGGKYTTYRRMAEVITDAVVARPGGLMPRCRTRHLRLLGACREPWSSFLPAETWRLRARYRLDEATARHLVQRYGCLASTVADYTIADPALARSVVDGEPDIFAEFAYQRDHEMAVRPEDHLLRRTRLGLFHAGTKISFSREPSASFITS